METKTLTPEESFQIINKAIANFKMNYKVSAKIFLLWGWILSLASFSHFIVLRILRSREAYDLMGIFSIGTWSVFIVTGLVILYFMLRKMNNTMKVYSYLDNYITKLWQVTGVSFFVAFFLCVKLGIAVSPIMLLIAGIGTTITGLVIKFRPLIIGGIAFFLFCMAVTFVSNDYMLVINGAAIVCGYLIPGYFLKSAKE